MTPELREKLVRLADEFETPAFLENDPSRFMHAVRGAANREAVAFAASALSFGSRAQFCAKIEDLLDACGGDMARWIDSGGYARAFAAGDGRCFYRFYTRGDMRAFFDAYAAVVRAHGSLGAYVRGRAAGHGPQAVAAIREAFAGAGGLVPQSPGSACKRVCMFLRWMARDGSPVDLGLWSGFLDKSSLAMPLDVHVMRQSRMLGLSKSQAPSMRVALALSQTLSEAFPGDPLRGDFALFGLGVRRAEWEDAR